MSVFVLVYHIELTHIQQSSRAQSWVGVLFLYLFDRCLSLSIILNSLISGSPVRLSLRLESRFCICLISLNCWLCISVFVFNEKLTHIQQSSAAQSKVGVLFLYLFDLSLLLPLYICLCLWWKTHSYPAVQCGSVLGWSPAAVASSNSSAAYKEAL